MASPSPSLGKRSPRLTDFRVVAVLPESCFLVLRSKSRVRLSITSKFAGSSLTSPILKEIFECFLCDGGRRLLSQHHAVGFHSSLHVSFRKTGERVFCGQDHHALLMRDIPTHKPAEDHRRCDALCFIQHIVFPLLLLVTTGCLLIRDPRIYLRQRSESACEF